MKNITTNLKAVLLGIVVAVGVSYAAAGTFTGPACAPPNCNADAPLNVGTSNQVKAGRLVIGTTDSGAKILVDNVDGPALFAGGILQSSGAFFTGPVAIRDGSQGAGKILVSDALGVASWASLSSAAVTYNCPNGSVLSVRGSKSGCMYTVDASGASEVGDVTQTPVLRPTSGNVNIRGSAGTNYVAMCLLETDIPVATRDSSSKGGNHQARAVRVSTPVGATANIVAVDPANQSSAWTPVTPTMNACQAWASDGNDGWENCQLKCFRPLP